MNARPRLATVEDVDRARRRSDWATAACLLALAGLFLGGSLAFWRADQERRSQAVSLCEWVRVSAQRDAVTADAQYRWAQETARLWALRGEVTAANLIGQDAIQERRSASWRAQAATIDCADPREAIHRLTTTTTSNETTP